MKSVSYLLIISLFIITSTFAVLTACESDEEDPVRMTFGDDDDDTGPPEDDDDSASDDDSGDDDDSGPPTTEGFEYIPSTGDGFFFMGSKNEEIGRSLDEVRRQVTLTYPMEVMQTEVTQGEFQAVMGYNPSAFPGCGPNCPVESVNWLEAMAYTIKMNELPEYGYEPCYEITDIQCQDGQPGDMDTFCKDNGGVGGAGWTILGVRNNDCDGFRLPSEAEFEYAMRAGEQAAFYNGHNLTADQYDAENCLAVPEIENLGYYCNNSGGATDDVAQFEPNAWGLYDMAGNVQEWVFDHFQESNPAGSVTDPDGIQYQGTFGDTDDFWKMIRGGGFISEPYRLRSAKREFKVMSYEAGDVGFRVVRTIK